MRSPLSGWLGGKSKLAQQIISMIPDHVTYMEPFAGAAWVFFNKQPSKAEVLNDINHEIVNLFRCIQNHEPEFVRQFEHTVISRDEFERLKKIPPETLTDIQRAARFYYIQKNCYGGKIANPTFGTWTSRASTLNLTTLQQDMRAIHTRLARTTLECLPYGEAIERYDKPETFFYIDPPYWDCENDYGKGFFSKADFHKLADQLGGIQGRFILSLNDVPEIRDIFSGFQIETVELLYSVNRGEQKPARELLITNYEPQAARQGGLLFRESD